MTRALLYSSQENEKVMCELCSHQCLIKNGRNGICGVRRNTDGVLNTLVYGRLIARNADPIEKKPLFHLMPGSLSFSIATVGCNFRCRFCQNADIAQMPNDRDGMIAGREISPETVVDEALATGCRSIAYTYTEPTVFFEFAYDTAGLAHQKGLKNVFVTNGYMSAKALEMMAPFLDGANVDLKAYSDGFYRTQCGAKLEPVKETLRRMKSLGVLVEVTTLIIPGLNDDDEQLGQLAAFLVEDLGPETPWHISRFHPTYRLTDREPTPTETLRRAGTIGRNAGLHYIYLGNVPGERLENTVCHQCGAMLIERWGFRVQRNAILDGGCPDCGTPVYGVEMSEVNSSPR
jgi:pyruvate formate lyase activating enzyme